MNKSESKYFNTAKKMDEALIKLLENKDLDFISVKDVCAEANVNRSTFYLHYDNTYDLLEESMDYMSNVFMSYFKNDEDAFVEKIASANTSELMLVTPEYLSPYLNFVKEHKRVFLATIKHPQRFNVASSYGKMFNQVFDPILEKFDVPKSDRRYMMDFYLNGCSAIVSRWIENDCKESIEEISSIIEKCTVSGRESLFKK